MVCSNIFPPFDITHYFLTDIVVWFMRQSGAETKYRVPTVQGPWVNVEPWWRKSTPKVYLYLDQDMLQHY